MGKRALVLFAPTVGSNKGLRYFLNHLGANKRTSDTICLVRMRAFVSYCKIELHVLFAHIMGAKKNLRFHSHQSMRVRALDIIFIQLLSELFGHMDASIPAGADSMPVYLSTGWQETRALGCPTVWMLYKMVWMSFLRLCPIWVGKRDPGSICTHHGFE